MNWMRAALARLNLGRKLSLLRFFDLCLLPFFLSGDAVLIYLLARGMSLLVPLSLWPISRKAGPYLADLAKPEPGTAFQAVATRINLGFLMIGGGVALGIFWAAPFVLPFTGPQMTLTQELLGWLLVGQSGTMLFGATRMIMQAVGRGAFLALLEAIAAVCLSLALILGGAAEPVFFAQAVAAAQLTQAVLSALLLTQCGVWPGLTALFFTGIRLR